MYTTADLLTSVRTRGMFPDASTGSLSSDNLLMIASEELHSVMVPMILAAREKYYETYQDTVVTANQANYSIPQRAIGGVLSAVQFIYGINVVNLEPIDPVGVTQTNTALTPRSFYFENNKIVLYPTPSTTNYSIRMRYFQRPSVLEQTINCGQIASFDPIAMTATVSSVPATWTTGTSVDFVPSTLPYTPYGLDYSVVSVVGTTIAFSSLPTGVAVGHWIAPAGKTPIPEVPNEMFSVLAQATLCRALESIGDRAGLESAQASLQIKIANALKLITPRDQSGQKKIVSQWRNW